MIAAAAMSCARSFQEKPSKGTTKRNETLLLLFVCLCMQHHYYYYYYCVYTMAVSRQVAVCSRFGLLAQLIHCIITFGWTDRQSVVVKMQSVRLLPSTARLSICICA